MANGRSVSMVVICSTRLCCRRRPTFLGCLWLVFFRNFVFMVSRCGLCSDMVDCCSLFVGMGRGEIGVLLEEM